MEKEKSFEEMMADLEKIAKDLEEGNLSLDESVQKFEEGMLLSKKCSSILESAEKRITLLVEQEDGKILEEDFNK